MILLCVVYMGVTAPAQVEHHHEGLVLEFPLATYFPPAVGGVQHLNKGPTNQQEQEQEQENLSWVSISEGYDSHSNPSNLQLTLLILPVWYFEKYLNVLLFFK